MKKIFKNFNEFINESHSLQEGYRTKAGDIIKDYMVVIWNSNYDEIIMAYTSNDENDLDDIPKGELADKIESYLNSKIDTDDFYTEIIKTKDFMDDYASPKNPNRIDINRIIIAYI